MSPSYHSFPHNTQAQHTTQFNSMDNLDPDHEPVLLVSPKLTKSTYAQLLNFNLVPRKWHPEGRYGSRTHKVNDKIGIPLQRCRIQLIQQLLDKDKDKDNKLNVDHDHSAHEHLPLIQLLHEPGVELIFQPPVESNKVPKDEPFDAEIHPHLMPSDFILKLQQVVKSMVQPLDVSSQSTCTRTHSRAPMKDTQEDGAATSKKQKTHFHDNENLNKPPAPAPALVPASFTFCELFAGIGGFGVALEALGGKCVFASEIYAPSIRVYQDNLDTCSMQNHAVSGDIWEVSSSSIPKHDLLVAGFPCQPFSSLGDQPGLKDVKVVSGRKKGLRGGGDVDIMNADGGVDVQGNININHSQIQHDDMDSGDGGGRGQLFTQIVRVLKDVQPHAFLLENVPGIVTTDGGEALKTIVAALVEVGYSVNYQICSSRGMTVQSRKRLYIIGTRKSANTDAVNGSEEPREFQFPFVPDLHLRAKHILHTRLELETDFLGTGVPEELIQDCDFGKGGVPSPASMFRLTDAQMDQLMNRSKVWRPAKLAWDNTSCDTIDSHYGITIGKVSAHKNNTWDSVLLCPLALRRTLFCHVIVFDLLIFHFDLCTILLHLQYYYYCIGQFTISPMPCSSSSSTIYASRMCTHNGIQ